MTNGVDRTRGTTGRASVPDVLAWIDAHVSRLPAEEVPSAQCVGRMLAEDVKAPADLPPLDRAAVDGFALRSNETIGASSYNPLPFRLGPSMMELPTGCAAPVHAGGVLPRGADAVAPPDLVVLEAQATCAVIEPVAVGNGIERAGSHGRRGTTLAAKGRRLGAHDVGLLSYAGVARVCVVRQPRVRCVLSGRDLADLGSPLSPGAVPDADGPMVKGLVERDGGVISELVRAGRDPATLRDAIASSGVDLVLVAGSTGSGTDDYAAVALSDAGELAMHGVALSPGETAGMGRTAAGVPVFLLPGTPVACLWAYEFFAGRAVRCLGARAPDLPFPSRKMTAASKIISQIGMTEVYPVRRLSDDTVEPLVSFNEAGLTAAVRADGFVIVSEGSEGFRQGAGVAVYLYNDQSHAHF